MGAGFRHVSAAVYLFYLGQTVHNFMSQAMCGVAVDQRRAHTGAHSTAVYSIPRVKTTRLLPKRMTYCTLGHGMLRGRATHTTKVHTLAWSGLYSLLYPGAHESWKCILLWCQRMIHTMLSNQCCNSIPHFPMRHHTFALSHSWHSIKKLIAVININCRMLTPSGEGDCDLHQTTAAVVSWCSSKAGAQSPGKEAVRGPVEVCTGVSPGGL